LDAIFVESNQFDEEVAAVRSAMLAASRSVFETLRAKGELSIAGTPISGLILDWWDMTFTGPLVRMFLQRRFFAFIMEHYKPSALAIGPISAPEAAAAIAYGRQHDIPTIELRVTDGLAMGAQATLTANVSCVTPRPGTVGHGSGEIELYRRSPRTGSLRREIAIMLPRATQSVLGYSTQDVRSDLKCKSSERLIVFASRHDVDDGCSNLVALLDVLQTKSKYRLLVKIDTSESLQSLYRYEDLIAGRGLQSRCKVMRDYNIYRALAGADLVVALHGAVAVDAASLRKPVLWEHINASRPSDLIAIECCTCVGSTEELNHFIEAFLTNAPTINDQKERQAAFFHAYPYLERGGLIDVVAANMRAITALGSLTHELKN
jgi:hypothetical protein